MGEDELLIFLFCIEISILLGALPQEWRGQIYQIAFWIPSNFIAFLCIFRSESSRTFDWSLYVCMYADSFFGGINFYIIASWYHAKFFLRLTFNFNLPIPPLCWPRTTFHLYWRHNSCKCKRAAQIYDQNLWVTFDNSCLLVCVSWFVARLFKHVFMNVQPIFGSFLTWEKICVDLIFTYIYSC